MYADSTVTIIGNLTRDPEVTEVNGNRVMSFSVAVNTGKRNEDGTFGADFYRVSSWNSIDYLSEKLATGTQVIVTGSQTLGAYTSKKDNLPHPDARITAFDVKVKARPKGWKDKADEGAA